MARVRDIMEQMVVTCTPDWAVSEVAQQMKQYDHGSLPVIDNPVTARPVGMITDRDIVVEALAGEHGRPLVEDCMTSPAICVNLDATLEECARMMGEHRIRRIPVINHKGTCVGIVALADLARHVPPELAGEVLQQISVDADDSLPQEA